VKKLTIITVCFNAEKSILRTIESVNYNKEKYDNLEYIIIDGASSDSTLSIIEQAYKDGVVDKYLSEVDGGIYDAMNKGIALAKGYYISFLMADDYYLDLGDILVSLTDDNLIYQCGIKLTVDGHDLNTFIARDSQENYIKNKMPIHHPSTFVPLVLYKEYGVFSAVFKVSGDYEWITRCMKSGVHIKNINTITTVMALGGISGLQGYKYKLPEDFFIRARNGYGLLSNIGLLLKSLAITYLRLLKRKVI